MYCDIPVSSCAATLLGLLDSEYEGATILLNVGFISDNIPEDFNIYHVVVIIFIVVTDACKYSLCPSWPLMSGKDEDDCS
jgi:hypothetical protein